MSKPFYIAGSKSKQSRSNEVVDIAARYLVYKLYDATNGQPGVWQVIGKVIGERQETVMRAVERGWVIVQEVDVGRIKVRSGLLTEEGRRVARRALTG